MKHLHKLFGILLHRKVVPFPIYLFVQSFISADSLIFLSYFGSLGYNPILSIYFVLKLFQLLPLGVIWLLCPFDIPHHHHHHHHFLSASLLSGSKAKEVTGSSHSLPAPVLESDISPKSPGSFHWKWYQKPRSGCWVLSLIFKSDYKYTLLSFPQSFWLMGKLWFREITGFAQDQD